MKKISSYLPSLLISIVLVFTFIGTAVIALTDININANSCISLAKKNALEKAYILKLKRIIKVNIILPEFRRKSIWMQFQKIILFL